MKSPIRSPYLSVYGIRDPRGGGGGVLFLLKVQRQPHPHLHFVAAAGGAVGGLEEYTQLSPSKDGKVQSPAPLSSNIRASRLLCQPSDMVEEAEDDEEVVTDQPARGDRRKKTLRKKGKDEELKKRRRAAAAVLAANASTGRRRRGLTCFADDPAKVSELQEWLSSQSNSPPKKMSP